jgi:hypothetical protein
MMGSLTAPQLRPQVRPAFSPAEQTESMEKLSSRVGDLRLKYLDDTFSEEDNAPNSRELTDQPNLCFSVDTLVARKACACG